MGIEGGGIAAEEEKKTGHDNQRGDDHEGGEDEEKGNQVEAARLGVRGRMRDKEAKKSWGCIFSAAAAALCQWQMMNAVKQTQPGKNGHVEKNGERGKKMNHCAKDTFMNAD